MLFKTTISRFLQVITEFEVPQDSGVGRKKFPGGGFKVGGPASEGAGKFSKICKKIQKKIAKSAVFSPILQRNYKSMR